MILSGARGQAVTVVRRVKQLDANGKPIRDSYGAYVWIEQSTAVQGLFNPGASTEQVQGQDVLVTQPSMYLPAGTDVSSIDRLEYGGASYEVDGQPTDWSSPFSGWRPGVEVRLRRVTG